MLDLEKCTRCDECTKACADAHDGVTRLIREGLRFDKYLVASSCRSCLDPVLHGRLPGRLDPPHRHQGDHHRGLVHRLRQVRRELPLRQHQHPGAPRRRPPRPRGHHLRPLPPVPDKQPSCVYACPHDAAHRMSGPELWQIVNAELSTRR